MDAMLNDWWRVWKRRSSGRATVAEELVSIATGRTVPGPASRLVREWVQPWDPGWNPPDRIYPELAHQLLNFLKGFKLVSEQHHPPAHMRPTSSNRLGVHRIYKVGRVVYKAHLTTAGLKDEDGSLVTCASKADSMLWNSRKAIWTADPPQGCEAGPIRDHFFAENQRDAELPAHPAPSLFNIAKHILKSADLHPEWTTDPTRCTITGSPSLQI